jgi:hypothetical protein
MPHSGMSMVGLALSALGVDLGPESELPPEATYADRSRIEARFARINDAILDAAGAAWNSPPESNGAWAGRPELEPLKREARTVCDSLALAEPWGWVDPFNSLTLPFWRGLFPDLEILVCVRHPLELARALHADGAVSIPEAVELWRAYYGAIDDLGESYVVTHLARYREDAERELKRVARELHLAPSPSEWRHAISTIDVLSGNGGASDATLPPEVRRLYSGLLAADVQERPSRGASSTEQKLEIAHLRRELERAKGRIDDLQAQVDAHAGWERERDELLANLEAQLLERDEELKRAWEENEWRRGVESTLREETNALREQTDALREETKWLQENEAGLNAQLESMMQTRLWRLGTRYWSLRDGLRGRFRRS